MNDTTSRLQSRLAKLLDQSALADVAAQAGLGDDAKVVRRAAHFAMPAILDNMGNFSRSSAGASVVEDLLEARSRNIATDGRSLAAHLFEGRLPRAAEQLADKAGITQRAAASTIEVMSGWTFDSVVSLADYQQDRNSFARLLVEHGGQKGDLPIAPLSEQQQASAAAAEELRTSEQTNARVTTARSIQNDVAVAEKTVKTNGSGSGKLIGAALAGLLLIGGAFMVLGGGGDDAADGDAVVATAAASETPDETLFEPEPAAADPVSSTESADQGDAADDSRESAPAEADAQTGETPEQVVAVAADPVDPALAYLSVPMRDIKGVSPEANSAVDFTFNKLTGEICFDVGSFGVGAPYASHIHAGDFGVKGGVVADLGLLEDQASGCIDNLRADTLAILDQPSRHYAELHDAGGEWTVRGQLSETSSEPGIVPLVIPMRDILGTSPNSSGVLNFDFNTLTGEVCYSVVAVGVTPPFDGHIHAGGFGVKGGVVLDLGGLDTGMDGCVQNDLNDTLAILGNPDSHYAELHDAGGEWTVRGQLSETVDNPGIVRLAVPMVDIKNVEPSAAGTLNFEFNTVSGEICYDVSAINITPPFASHIHAGEFGVKGGVVLDLGGLQDGAGGCVRNQPNDTLAILADPSGHYAELHDAGGDWTIRGQLSEAMADLDPSAVNLLVDRDGGGASLRLFDGTIYLEGDVSSQDVADELLAPLTGISTPVVNNLSVVAGAPLPSGRVVISDSVFFDSGEDEIKALDVGTVAALLELAESRPDWVMTIVGHTDDIGTDVYNLELSLRRAQALRDVLTGQGMNSDNMRIRGAGETAPIASNATEDGRAQNRRLEFEFSPA